MCEFLTSAQLRERFKVSAMTLWRWERDEELRFPEAVRLGRAKRWRRADIEKWESTLARIKVVRSESC